MKEVVNRRKGEPDKFQPKRSGPHKIGSESSNKIKKFSVRKLSKYRRGPPVNNETNPVSSEQRSILPNSVDIDIPKVPSPIDEVEDSVTQSNPPVIDTIQPEVETLRRSARLKVKSQLKGLSQSDIGCMGLAWDNDHESFSNSKSLRNLRVGWCYPERFFGQ